MSTNGQALKPTETVDRRVKKRRTAATAKPTVKAFGKPEVRVFVSYSHQDGTAQANLHTHLAPWRRDGVVVWNDENIDPGAEINPEIARELRSAHIFVALLSPAYLDSDYCWNKEYRRAMRRRAQGSLRVIGVVVKPCAWKQTRAARFKLLPRDGLPPERWSSNAAAFANVAEGIGEVIRQVRVELKVHQRASAKAPRESLAKSTAPKAKRSSSKKAGLEGLAESKSSRRKFPGKPGTGRSGR